MIKDVGRMYLRFDVGDKPIYILGERRNKLVVCVNMVIGMKGIFTKIFNHMDNHWSLLKRH